MSVSYWAIEGIGVEVTPLSFNLERLLEIGVLN